MKRPSCCHGFGSKKVKTSVEERCLFENGLFGVEGNREILVERKFLSRLRAFALRAKISTT